MPSLPALMKKKGGSLMIAIGGMKPSSSKNDREEQMESPKQEKEEHEGTEDFKLALESCAKGLIQAIKSGDSKAVAMHLYNAHTITDDAKDKGLEIYESAFDETEQDDY